MTYRLFAIIDVGAKTLEIAVDEVTAGSLAHDYWRRHKCLRDGVDALLIDNSHVYYPPNRVVGLRLVPANK